MKRIINHVKWMMGMAGLALGLCCLASANVPSNYLGTTLGFTQGMPGDSPTSCDFHFKLKKYYQLPTWGPAVDKPWDGTPIAPKIENDEFFPVNLNTDARYTQANVYTAVLFDIYDVNTNELVEEMWVGFYNALNDKGEFYFERVGPHFRSQQREPLNYKFEACVEPLPLKGNKWVDPFGKETIYFDSLQIFIKLDSALTPPNL